MFLRIFVIYPDTGASFLTVCKISKEEEVNYLSKFLYNTTYDKVQFIKTYENTKNLIIKK